MQNNKLQSFCYPPKFSAGCAPDSKLEKKKKKKKTSAHNNLIENTQQTFIQQIYF